LYLDPSTHELQEAAVDAFVDTGSGSLYPPYPWNNDVLVATPMCSVMFPLSGFWVRPDTGAIVYACSATEYYEGTNTLTALSGFDLIALGPNGTAIGRSGGFDVVVDSRGFQFVVTAAMPVSLSAFVGARTREVRSQGANFWVALPQATGGPPCELWQISSVTGQALMLSRFEELPTGLTSTTHCLGRLDRDLRLWTPATDAMNNDVIVMRPLQFDDPPKLLYTEANRVPSDFSTYPPFTFTFFDPGTSSLLSGQ
jgi:hypothetical protein